MNDPRVLAIISVIFVLLGLYNISLGMRRIREARLAGNPLRWYKQVNLLTGIEYVLLVGVFLLSIINQQGAIAPGMRGLVVPLYFLLLLASAVLAGIVIRQGLFNARAARASGRSVTLTSPPRQDTQPIQSVSASAKVHSEEQAQRQRERRKKAAAARRRKAGKA